MLLKKSLLAMIVIFTAVTLSACGYRLLKQTRNGYTAPGYKNYNTINGIFIKPFKNLTYKSGIGVYFSNNLSYYLNTTTSMFTSNASNAKYFISGKIISINNSVMSYTGIAAAVQYSISASITISLYKTNGKIILHNVNLTSNASYFNYINPLVGHKQEKMALKIVSKRIAKKIIILIESNALINQTK